jgi:cell cycle checkpoint control protein RAD9A
VRAGTFLCGGKCASLLNKGLLQPLLAILKHKALEKTLERLDLIVVDGVFNHEGEDFDGLEGKLIVRLHCKHGEVHYIGMSHSY